jgi:hypothetical protein
MEIATLIACINTTDNGGIETLLPGLDLNSRYSNMINAMVEDELLENKITAPHPNAATFIEAWREYIVLPQEDTEQYATMKKKFINAFGEKWFTEWLIYSYYFVRSATMQQRGWVDNNNRAVGS